MKLSSLLVGLGLCCLLTAPAHAFIPIPLSVEELNRHADLVVRGTVKEKTCRRDEQGRIYTEVVLQVAETWRGKPAAERLTIVHGGGVLGNRAETAIGQVEYTPGEEVVAFLIHNPRGEAVTVGMAQGKFHLERNSKDSTVWASNPFHAGETADKSRAKSLGARLAVDDLKRRVREATR
jgi:hypothetical protein